MIIPLQAPEPFVNLERNMRLTLLGHPRYFAARGEVGLSLTKPAALLVYLACRADWVSRDELALFLRPEADDKTARSALRITLNRARNLPWSEGLEQDQNRLRFSPESDLADFRKALGRGDWATATSLYQGDFLAGATLALPSFMAWLDVERSALATAWQEAALKYADSLSEDPQESARVLALALAQDPLAEDILQRYLRSAYLAGEAAAALTAFERFELQLKDELSLEPLAETAKLAATIRASEQLTPITSQAPVSVPLAVLRPPITVGRDEEKKRLSQNTGLSVIKGEAGVGKSRLAADLAPNALTLQGRDGLNHVPYFPVLEFIKTLPELPDLQGYNEDVQRLLLGGANAPPQDGEIAKARLLEALALLLESQTSPIIFEDLQWADAATLELFVFMAHRATRPIFTTLRSFEVSVDLAETLSSLRGLPGYKELELHPLSQEAVSDLLNSLSSQDSDAPKFASWLTQTSGGNPFFLLETLRALFEAQILSETETHWYSSLDQVTQSYAELALPPGVAAIVERRVKGLSSEAKRLLDIAAVLADSLTPELAARLGALSVWAAADGLSELESRGLLKDARFAHDLTRQALYEALPESKRRFIHEQIAEALDKADELVRAEHYYLAGDFERTAQLWNSSLTYLDSLGREEEVMALAERTAELDTQAPARYQAMVTLADWHRVRGDMKMATELLKTARDKSGDATVRMSALTYLAYLDLMVSKSTSAIKLIKQALSETHFVTDVDVLREAKIAQADIYRLTGRIPEAIEILEPVLGEVRREHPGTFKVANMATALAAAYNASGRYHEGLKHHEEAYAIGSKLTMTYQKISSAMNIGFTLNYLGRPEEALNLMLDAQEASTYPIFSRSLCYCISSAYLNLEEYERVEHYIGKCLEIYESENENPDPRVLSILGKTYAKRGEQSKTSEVVERLLSLIDSLETSNSIVRAYIGIKELGTEEQLARATPHFEKADLSALHAHTKSQLDKALAGS